MFSTDFNLFPLNQSFCLTDKSPLLILKGGQITQHVRNQRILEIFFYSTTQIEGILENGEKIKISAEGLRLSTISDTNKDIWFKVVQLSDNSYKIAANGKLLGGGTTESTMKKEPTLSKKDIDFIGEVNAGQVEKVRQLLKSGANPNLSMKGISRHIYIKETSQTVLMHACTFSAQRYFTIVQLLIDAGANVNATHTDAQFTALAYAAITGNQKAVDLLLSKGANPNTNGNDGSLLAEMCLERRTDIIKSLLKAKADIRWKTRKGLLPMTAAVKIGNTEILGLLVEHGLDLNEKDGDKSLIDIAFETSQKAMIIWLIEKGVSFLPQHFSTAALKKWEDVIHLMIKKGIDAHHPSFQRLLFDVLSADTEVALPKILIDAGFDVNAGNKLGYTPLSIALERRQSDIVKRLIEKGAKLDQQVLNTALREFCCDINTSKTYRLSELAYWVKELVEYGANFKLIPMHLYRLLPEENQTQIQTKLLNDPDFFKTIDLLMSTIIRGLGVSLNAIVDAGQLETLKSLLKEVLIDSKLMFCFLKESNDVIEVRQNLAEFLISKLKDLLIIKLYCNNGVLNTEEIKLAMRDDIKAWKSADINTLKLEKAQATEKNTQKQLLEKKVALEEERIKQERELADRAYLQEQKLAQQRKEEAAKVEAALKENTQAAKNAALAANHATNAARALYHK